MVDWYFIFVPDFNYRRRNHMRLFHVKPGASHQPHPPVNVHVLQMLVTCSTCLQTVRDTSETNIFTSLSRKKLLVPWAPNHGYYNTCRRSNNAINFVSCRTIRSPLHMICPPTLMAFANTSASQLRHSQARPAIWHLHSLLMSCLLSLLINSTHKSYYLTWQ